MQTIHHFSLALLQKLQGMFHRPITTIVAPSGYGKTTCVQDFLSSKAPKNCKVHWFTAAREAPRSTWFRLARQMQQVDEKAGNRLLEIGWPNRINFGEILETIQNIRCPQKNILVIDDYHRLHESLSSKLTHSPLIGKKSNLHLVILSQHLPMRPGTDHIHRIGIEDLRFDAQNISAYFSAHKIPLTEDQAGKICAYTEGWIVAVYLQLLLVQKNGLAAIEKPAPDTLTLMERLVWDQSDEETKDALLQLSLFEDISPAKICQLFGTEDVPPLVHAVLRENPFVRYDEEENCYRAHAVLIEMLRRQMGKAGVASKRRYHDRAGAVFAGNNQAARALECFCATQNYEALLSLPLCNLTMAKVGGIYFSQRAFSLLEQCPEDIKRRHPLSLLRIAYLLFAAMRREECARLLEETHCYIQQEKNAARQKQLRAEWTFLHGLTCFPDLGQMSALLREAQALSGGRVSLLSANEPFLFTQPLYLFHTAPGRARETIKKTAQFFGLYEQLTGGGGGAEVLFQAEDALHRGDGVQATLLCHKAAYLAGLHSQDAVLICTARYLAEIALEEMDIEGFSQALEMMERSSVLHEENIDFCLRLKDIVHGDLYQLLGLSQRTSEWVQRGEAQGLPCNLYDGGRASHAMFLLWNGEWAKYIGIAQARLEELRQDKIQGILPPALSHLGMAYAHLQLKQPALAEEELEKAAALLLPDGYHQYFARFFNAYIGHSIPGGEKAMSGFFARHPGAEGAIREQLAKLQSGRRKLKNAYDENPHPVKLTPREEQVALRAAKGMRNPEIARELGIAERTVKTHLTAVFRKLDIDRRAKLADLLC